MLIKVIIQAMLVRLPKLIVLIEKVDLNRIASMVKTVDDCDDMGDEDDDITIITTTSTTAIDNRQFNFKSNDSPEIQPS